MGREDSLETWRVAVNILNKQSQTGDKWLMLQLGAWAGGLTTPHFKKPACYEMLYRTLNFDR
jgi:hypothetical protein